MAHEHPLRGAHVRDHLNVSRYDAPRPRSDRKCLLCGFAPAGRVHVKVSLYRGDDEVYACCRDCAELPKVAFRLIRAAEAPTRVHALDCDLDEDCTCGGGM